MSASDFSRVSISDPRFGGPVVFVSLARPQVIYFKVLLESYEGIASFRTQDPEHEPGRGLVAILVAEGFAADLVAVLAETADSVDLRPYAPSAAEIDTLYTVLTTDEPDATA
jgi:hypothetical protein